MKLRSYERYRATAAERRVYGGNIVTKYLVQHEGESFFVWGKGKTQHDRKRQAAEKAVLLISSGQFSSHKYAHQAA